MFAAYASTLKWVSWFEEGLACSLHPPSSTYLLLPLGLPPPLSLAFPLDLTQPTASRRCLQLPTPRPDLNPHYHSLPPSPNLPPHPFALTLPHAGAYCCQSCVPQCATHSRRGHQAVAVVAAEAAMAALMGVWFTSPSGWSTCRRWTTCT